MTKFKIIFTLLFILLTFSKLNAQNSDLYAVKMKSGLVIVCEVLKIVPDSFVKIRQFGFESKINITDIESVDYSGPNLDFIKRNYASNNPIKKAFVYDNIPDTGWHFGIGIGFSIGSGTFGPTSSFVTRANVLRPSLKDTRLNYGMYIALDPYSLYEAVILNPGLEARYLFSKQKPRSVLLQGYAGYGFNINAVNTTKYGGLSFGGGLGTSSRLKSGVIFSVLFGYKYQALKEEVFLSQLRQEVDYVHHLGRFEIRTEWRF